MNQILMAPPLMDLLFILVSDCVSSPDQTKNDKVPKFGTDTPSTVFFDKETLGAANFEKQHCHVEFRICP